MSLVLFVFYWVGVPLLIVLVARSMWRKSRTPVHKGLVVAASAMILLGLLWLAEGEKWLLDRQVREMCARDGGIKVYETVKLPPEKFDQWGNVGILDKNHAKPTDEYYYESEEHYYQQGNPALLRSRGWIVRRSDGKVLGESIRYGRGGGDLPGPWYGTSFDCPSIADAEGKLETSIFLKGNEK